MIDFWSEWIKCLNMYKYFCIRIRWSINIKSLSYWAYKVSKYQIEHEWTNDNIKIKQSYLLFWLSNLLVVYECGMLIKREKTG